MNKNRPSAGSTAHCRFLHGEYTPPDVLGAMKKVERDRSSRWMTKTCHVLCHMSSTLRTPEVFVYTATREVCGPISCLPTAGMRMVFLSSRVHESSYKGPNCVGCHGSKAGSSPASTNLQVFLVDAGKMGKKKSLPKGRRHHDALFTGLEALLYARGVVVCFGSHAGKAIRQQQQL